MYEYKELRGLTRAAAAALVAYMVFGALFALMSFASPRWAGPDAPTPADYVGIPFLLAFLASIVLVACWIYRASANAHALSADMTIRPGWAVGWFFVPFANLVMPYQAMKETWRESHEAAGRYEEAQSPIVGWWWGLWICGNVLARLGSLFGAGTDSPLAAAPYVDLLDAVLNAAAALVLVRLMLRLGEAQRLARHAAAFV